MFLIFLGPPGSGKGTQAQNLVQDLGYVHISTGVLMRKEVATGGELASEIEKTINSGNFVPDELIFRLITNVISENVRANVIFDGFPRTLNQAQWLDKFLEQKNSKVDLVLDFDVQLDQVTSRIDGRYNCLNCGTVYHQETNKPKVDGICNICGGNNFEKRQDDTVDVVKTRVQVYQREAEPIRNFYIQKGILKSIDASRDVEKVQTDIRESLEQREFKSKGDQ